MRLARRLLYIILDGGGGRVFLAVAQPQPGCAFCYVPGSPHDLLPQVGSCMPHEAQARDAQRAALNPADLAQQQQSVHQKQQQQQQQVGAPPGGHWPAAQQQQHERQSAAAATTWQPQPGNSSRSLCRTGKRKAAEPDDSPERQGTNQLVRAPQAAPVLCYCSTAAVGRHTL